MAWIGHGLLAPGSLSEQFVGMTVSYRITAKPITKLMSSTSTILSESAKDIVRKNFTLNLTRRITLPVTYCLPYLSTLRSTLIGRVQLVKTPNFKQEKKQREMAQKKKNEQKQQEKAQRKGVAPDPQRP